MTKRTFLDMPALCLDSYVTGTSQKDIMYHGYGRLFIISSSLNYEDIIKSVHDNIDRIQEMFSMRSNGQIMILTDDRKKLIQMLPMVYYD